MLNLLPTFHKNGAAKKTGQQKSVFSHRPHKERHPRVILEMLEWHFPQP